MQLQSPIIFTEIADSHWNAVAPAEVYWKYYYSEYYES